MLNQTEKQVQAQLVKLQAQAATITKKASILLNWLNDKAWLAKSATKEKVNAAINDITDVRTNVMTLQNKIKTNANNIGIARFGKKFAEEVGQVADESFDVLKDATDAIEHAQELINPERAKEELEKKDKEGEDKEDLDMTPEHEGEESPEEEKKEHETGEEAPDDMPMNMKPEEVVAHVKSWTKGITEIKKALNVNATAIPPTGAKDSGDLVAGDGDPAGIELKHWKDGNQEGNVNIKKDKTLTNPATEPRLQDKGNPHDEKPYVNASLIRNDNMQKNAWVVSKNRKPIYMLTFADAAQAGGDGKSAETTANLKYFASQTYRKELIENIAKFGFKAVQKEVGGHFITAENAENPEYKETGHPGLENDGEQIDEKKYYSEAYGDSAYAGELTSNMKGASVENMAKLAAENASLKKVLAEKVQENVRRVKASRAVELARLKASRNIIPFTKQALTEEAKRVFAYTDQTYEEMYKTVVAMPLKNENALYKREITAAEEAPGKLEDADSGVVGNKLKGVEDNKAKADTEDMPSDVAGDAKLASAREAINSLTSDDRARVRNSVRGGIVPQLTKNASELQNQTLDLSDMWNTTANRLRKKGLNPDQFNPTTYRQ